MPLHPGVAQFLAAETAAPDFQSFDAAASAAYLAELRARRTSAAPGEQVAQIAERKVGDGQVPIRMYWPDGKGPHPAVVYFHGGGWVTGDLDMHDATCRVLARRCGAVVVNVDYRLAPEHPFPAALDDGYGVLTWLATDAAEFDIDGSRIALAGSSSGGNLAAALAMVARDRGGPPLLAQLLLYPVLDAGLATGSFRRFGTGYLLERDQMAWFWRCYLGADGDPSDPYAAPLQARDVSGLPAAVMVLPEYDPLRDEGLAYAERLVEAGVATDVIHAPGQIHGFAAFAGIFPDAESVMTRAAALCRVHLASTAELVT
jgi:acetyl esterase